MISELEIDTTGVRGPDGGFDLTLPERWGIGGGRLNGGYQLVAALAPALKAFMTAALKKGQHGLEDNGYIPVPDRFKERLTNAVNAIS